MLEHLELLGDVQVNEVGDVLAVHDLWHGVLVPRGVLEEVVLCRAQIR